VEEDFFDEVELADEQFPGGGGVWEGGGVGGVVGAAHCGDGGQVYPRDEFGYADERVQNGSSLRMEIGAKGK
jgi:hypothetical protein